MKYKLIIEKKETYDSYEDTMEHKNRVNELLEQVSEEFLTRGKNHDNSKLESFEKTTFDEYTPKLKNSNYGSDEYNEFLKNMKPALDNHYKNNEHHPEHYDNGINGMNLFDIVEMFFDWKSASERHDDGDIKKSLKINADRFKMDKQLVDIFENTIKYMGY